MNSKRRIFYSTISIIFLLLLEDIGQIHSFYVDSPSELVILGNHSNELQSMLEENTSLINRLRDRLGQLNNLVEEYENLLTGNEENILNLVAEVKEMWENLNQMTNEKIPQYIHYNSCSEKQEQEARIQDKTASKLKDDVFATLFNAKARKCKSEKEAFYEPLSKCFEIGKSCPDDYPNQMFHELVGTNEGICDCKDEIGQVFHKQTGECYQLNTQGPCKTGEWLIYNSSLGIKDAVTCESVPDKECKLDGTQVFYEGQCETLGSNSVCSDEREFLKRDSNDWEIVTCFLEIYTSTIFAKVPVFSCPPGSRRALNNQCRRVYKHGISNSKNIR